MGRGDPPPWRVRALTIRRENGDRDTLYLCTDCEPSIADFAKVLKRRIYNTDCDRCGQSEGQREQAARIGRP